MTLNYFVSVLISKTGVLNLCACVSFVRYIERLCRSATMILSWTLSSSIFAHNPIIKAMLFPFSCHVRVLCHIILHFDIRKLSTSHIRGILWMWLWVRLYCRALWMFVIFYPRIYPAKKLILQCFIFPPFGTKFFHTHVNG